MPSVDLETLVPHRRPMLLIDEIVSFDDGSAAARAVAAGHWPLTGPQGVNPLILVELVAQTAAVNNGWELLKRDGPGADSRGWIVGIKSATFRVAVIPVGTTIMVESSNQFAYDNFREIRGTATIDGCLAADVTLQLMQAQQA